MTETKNILGISLGTRTIGMAMLNNGELIDWYIKAYKGLWCEQKKDVILDTIERMLDRYQIDAFAIKIPSAMDRHENVNQLYTEINLFAQHKGIPSETYSIQTLKEFLGEDVSNKRTLRSKVLGLFPELKNEFNKESFNRNAYYSKLFEAVIAAHVLGKAKR